MSWQYVENKHFHWKDFLLVDQKFETTAFKLKSLEKNLNYH